ncbi:hypothetical protein [Methylobacterium haplocladii]|uniref:Uncharacterized protein n=1 Tax=Methylobacterium haplocladii TaxID=1176176 RepID=A0A512IIU4_9HYPH|nr:hypothetical protein [Methylobacterium haplocladii]GEO97626.1 hypothetical protein MHA02_00140 [Methylobacterium haplocladii]GJD84499.1 hypothetical protein HPGCJGGD_2376 [Methylobacterium haplocladii]GLS57356.1 hypothetical protein GCM10007887_00110 [Methylobacterium haplocladii]
MRPAYRLSIAAAIFLGALGSQGARAQYDDEGDYDGPPPRRGGYEYRYEQRRLPPPRRLSGLNCDALQPGLLGPQPFSCPLPGPRPLGARCFCDTPVAPLSGGNTVAGRVVP